MASYTTLPPEIRSKVIASITDPEEIPRAWLVYRLVSKSFRQDVEEAFRTHYLQRVQIQYELYHLSKFGPMDLVFKFARLCEDGERVVFKPVAGDYEGKQPSPRSPPSTLLKGQHNHEEWRWEQMALWKRLFRSDPWYLTSLPPHCIVFDACVMDTELPKFEADYKATEISFLWKPMWTAFLGELAWMQRAEKEECTESYDGGGAEAAQLPGKTVPRVWEHRARELRLGRVWKEFMGEDFPKADYAGFAWQDQVKRVDHLEALRSSAIIMAELQFLEEDVDKMADVWDHWARTKKKRHQ